MQTKRHKTMSNTKIDFKDHYWRSRPQKSFDPYLSKIARYVRSVDNNIFRRQIPTSTYIDDRLIAKIRAMNANVPAGYMG